MPLLSTVSRPETVAAAAAPWPALRRELDAWRALGRPATLWWRDDDAALPTPALDRLLALACRRGVPLALAVVPARAAPALVRRLDDAPEIAVLQHGWSHADHTGGAKKAELGDDRPADVVAAELAAGRRRLAELFGPRALPVLVPPWNRIGPAVEACLPGLGFQAVSTFGPRRPAGPLPRVNCHADPIAWRAGRGFAGEAAVLGALIGHLADRRAARVDPDEPTGLLTHHLDTDAAGWAFLERLLAVTARHPAVAWRGGPALFATP